MKIYGKHAIKAAEKNQQRGKKIFFGKHSKYKEYGLKCQFRDSDEEFLETNEYYIKSDFSDFFDHDKIILLDGLMDPRNVGAIIRSAAAFGFWVLMRNGKGAPINSTVVQCASGGIDHIKIIELNNINSNLQTLKDKGFWIYGLHETGKEIINEYTTDKKIVLVIGSEDTGLSHIVQKEIDIVLSIKTEDFSTLNASVAASIGMFQLSKKT